MSMYLNHEEATEAFNRGEVLKISSTIMVLSKNKIKMNDSSYEVANRMPTTRHGHYEILSSDQYEVL